MENSESFIFGLAVRDRAQTVLDGGLVVAAGDARGHRGLVDGDCLLNWA